MRCNPALRRLAGAVLRTAGLTHQACLPRNLWARNPLNCRARFSAGFPRRGRFRLGCPMEAREAFAALNMIDHVGPVRVRQLLEHFGDAPAILRASKQQLVRVNGVGEDTAAAISAWESKVDLAAELKRVEEFGCRVIIQSDEEYPALLREIYDPPLVLYVKGA